METIWITLIAVGGLTFLTRLSFIVLFERWQPPDWVRRSLRFVPVAVLTAIFVPELVLRDGRMVTTVADARLLAGLLAVLVAWRTKNVLLTILIGMLAFLFLTFFLQA
jgi:branched-subunit amino acid transport protein